MKHCCLSSNALAVSSDHQFLKIKEEVGRAWRNWVKAQAGMCTPLAGQAPATARLGMKTIAPLASSKR